MPRNLKGAKRMSIVVVAVVLAAVLFYALKLTKKRTAAFRAMAPAMGYTYVGDRSPFTGTDMAGLTLITDTNRHRYRNVIAAADQRPVVVPEFVYGLYLGMNRRGKGAVTQGDFHNHSLVLYRVPHGSVPVFQLSARGAFGNMDVPLDETGFAGIRRKAGLDLGNATFSERYVVSTADESQVRMLFTPWLVKALVEQPPHTWLHIQASADWLLFYDPAMMLFEPERVKPALERIAPIAEAIMGTPGASGAAL
jgi:hypothetical protein